RQPGRGVGPAVLAQRPAEGGQHVLQPDRVGQEVLRPLLERLEQGLVVVADGQDRQVRVLDGELADHLQGTGLVRVEGDDGQVRGRGGDDVEEVLVAGALSLQPHEVHAQQQGAERLAGGFGRVYDRDALHGHHRLVVPRVVWAAFRGRTTPAAVT